MFDYGCVQRRRCFLRTKTGLQAMPASASPSDILAEAYAIGRDLVELARLVRGRSDDVFFWAPIW